MTALTIQFDEESEVLDVFYADDPQPLGRLPATDGRVDLSDVRRVLGRLATRAYMVGHQDGVTAAERLRDEGEAA